MRGFSWFLVFATVISPAVHAQAQATTKDPATARSQAMLCPGCGHFYTGETGKGLVLATVGIGSLLTGAVISLKSNPSLDCSSISCDTKNTGFTPLIVGGAVALGTYLYGIIDAGPSARRMNAKNGIQVESVTVQPEADLRPRGRAAVGLRLVLGR